MRCVGGRAATPWRARTGGGAPLTNPHAQLVMNSTEAFFRDGFAFFLAQPNVGRKAVHRSLAFAVLWSLLVAVNGFYWATCVVAARWCWCCCAAA